MPDNEHIKGLSEELLVAHEALEKGCNVSLPFGGKAKYDLLIERGGEVLKIQVKTASSNDHPLKQQIRGLDKYTKSQVDFFAGVVDLYQVDSDEVPSVDGPRHLFYKKFEEVGGKTARVNYRPPDQMTDHNREMANLPNKHDFNAKIEAQLPGRVQ